MLLLRRFKSDRDEILPRFGVGILIRCHNSDQSDSHGLILCWKVLPSGEWEGRSKKKKNNNNNNSNNNNKNKNKNNSNMMSSDRWDQILIERSEDLFIFTCSMKRLVGIFEWHLADFLWHFNAKKTFETVLDHSVIHQTTHCPQHVYSDVTSSVLESNMFLLYWRSFYYRHNDRPSQSVRRPLVPFSISSH